MQSDTFAVRPEQFTLASADNAPITGTVSHVESLGGETLVYVSTEHHNLITWRLFGQKHPEAGSRVGLAVAPQHGFHFDKNGQRMR